MLKQVRLHSLWERRTSGGGGYSDPLLDRVIRGKKRKTPKIVGQLTKIALGHRKEIQPWVFPGIVSFQSLKLFFLFYIFYKSLSDKNAFHGGVWGYGDAGLKIIL